MQTPDLEKVIQGLEHCGQPTECDGCPYDTGLVGGCFTRLKSDALELLRAQQPRILTPDEVEEEGVYWMEVIQGERARPCMVCSVTEDHFIIRRSAQTPFLFWKYQYGAFYRMWTSKPTDEQRKATLWT